MKFVENCSGRDHASRSPFITHWRNSTRPGLLFRNQYVTEDLRIKLDVLSTGHVESGLSDDYMNSGEAPYIIEQPTDVTVARHQPATLNCRAGGSPLPTVRWFKAGILVVSDNHRSLLPAGGLFFLRAAHGRTHSDAGVYWCEATNPYGTARSRNATLHVAGKYLYEKVHSIYLL